MLSGMLDIYLSSISNRMNEIMKVLTIIATIFIPLTFIVGLYGMNFKYMPELESPWGYPAVLLLMLAVSVFMLLYFRRKKWL
jgi:magnesium transporter